MTSPELGRVSPSGTATIVRAYGEDLFEFGGGTAESASVEIQGAATWVCFETGRGSHR